MKKIVPPKIKGSLPPLKKGYTVEVRNGKIKIIPKKPALIKKDESKKKIENSFDLKFVKEI